MFNSLAPAGVASLGMVFALGAAVVFSINDMAIKFLSGGYPLHQVILVRGMVGMGFLLCLIATSARGFGQLRSHCPKRQFLRVILVQISNITYFSGLAALPLADAVAIAFVAPVLITLLSMAFLGERVGVHRLFAVALGLTGTLILMRPGEGAFQLAGGLVLISAFSYAGTQLLTRSMRATESAMTTNFYAQLGFLFSGTLVGLTLGDGSWAGASDPSIAFLTRAWVWPDPHDLIFFGAAGLAVSAGGLMMTQAYRTMDAALVAPFEYAGIPMAILWGILIFNTYPDQTGLVGMGLILLAGLYTLWREHLRKGQIS